MGILQIRRESGPPTISALSEGQLYLDTLDNVVYVSNDSEWVRISRDLSSILASQTSSMLVSSSHSITSSYALTSADAVDITILATTSSNIFTSNQIISQSSIKTEIGAFTSSFGGDVIISGSVYVLNDLYVTASNSLYTTTASYALNGVDSIDFNKLATTGSNVFNGNQIINGALIVNSGSFYTSNDVIISGSATINCQERIGLNRILIGNNSKPYYSSYYTPMSVNNFTTWTASNASISQTAQFAISGNVVYSAQRSAGVFKSTDLGVSWINISPPSVTSATAIYVSQSAVWVSVLYSGVYKLFKSLNDGVTWISSSFSNASPINGIASINDTMFIGHGGLGVFRSSDGVTWLPVTSSMTGKIINSLVVSSSHIIAGGNSGEVYISSNLGDTWVQRNPSGDSNSVDGIAVSGSGIYVGKRTTGVYRTHNLGVNWVQKNTGLWNYSVRSIAVDENGVLFAGSEQGYVAYSVDSAESWNNQTKISTDTIWAFALLPNSQQVFTTITSSNMFAVSNALSLTNAGFSGAKTFNINANTLITGSVNITGSLLVSGSITGLINSASYAITASFVQSMLTSSYSLTSSYTSNINGSDGFISKFSGNNRVISSMLKEISPTVWTYGNQIITGSMSIGKELIVEGTGSNKMYGNLLCNNLEIRDLVLSSSVSIPTIISSTGVYGQLCFDNNYMYVCVGDNLWRRASLNTW